MDDIVCEVNLSCVNWVFPRISGWKEVSSTFKNDEVEDDHMCVWVTDEEVPVSSLIHTACSNSLESFIKSRPESIKRKEKVDEKEGRCYQ